MGIFDNLKKLKNYISGSGAELHLVIDDSGVATQNIVRVKILCQVKEHDVLVDKLYLSLKAEEMVKYRVSNSQYNTNSGVRHRGNANRTSYVTTHKEELVIDRNFRLEAHGEYEWDAEFSIPRSVPGTYMGVNARHEWKVLAGLSKKGNDPDSGWQAFTV